jgi:hypothetical protein
MGYLMGCRQNVVIVITGLANPGQAERSPVAADNTLLEF